MTTPERLAYDGLLAELSLNEPNCGWYEAPKLSDAKLAVVLAAYPGLHDDALSDMQLSVTDVIDGLASAGALSPWALIGTCYRIRLVNALRRQVLHDLQDIAEERAVREKYEDPDADSKNDEEALRV